MFGDLIVLFIPRAARTWHWVHQGKMPDPFLNFLTKQMLLHFKNKFLLIVLTQHKIGWEHILCFDMAGPLQSSVPGYLSPLIRPLHSWTGKQFSAAQQTSPLQNQVQTISELSQAASWQGRSTSICPLASTVQSLPYSMIWKGKRGT